jgi:hypothetical protein
MKLNFLVLILIFSSFSIIKTQFDCAETPQQLSLDEVDDSRNPDKELEIIRDYMWEIAENLDRKTNIMKKKIECGELPDEFPKEMKDKARKVRQNMKNWESTMLYPTAVWRMCIFPNFKINYVTWCKQKLALTKTKIKLNGKVENIILIKI